MLKNVEFRCHQESILEQSLKFAAFISSAFKSADCNSFAISPLSRKTPFSLSLGNFARRTKSTLTCGISCFRELLVFEQFKLSTEF